MTDTLKKPQSGYRPSTLYAPQGEPAVQFGALPAVDSRAASHFTDDEFITTEFPIDGQSVFGANGAGLRIPLEFTEHNIFVYLSASLSTGAGSQFLVDGRIEMSGGGQIKGSIPASIGLLAGANVSNRSRANLFVGGNYAFPEAMSLRLTAVSWETATSIILNPLKIYGNIDTINFRMKHSTSNVNGLRVYLGILSKNSPFVAPQP